VKVGLDAPGAPLAGQHFLVGRSFLLGTPFEGMVKDGLDPRRSKAWSIWGAPCPTR